MANAKKCDRCGKFYEKNILYSKEINGCTEHVNGMCMTTTNNWTADTMDLCDDCIHKLGLFLSGLELKEV